MADIWYLKVMTSLPDEESIKIIDSMPERDAICWMWVRLQILAAKCNDGGLVYLRKGVSYTDEMLASVFNRPLNVVRLALSTFKSLHMIELAEDGEIFIPYFSETQCIESMDRIHEKARLRQASYRARQKMLSMESTPKLIEANNETVTSPVTSPVTHSNSNIKEIIREEEENEANKLWLSILDVLKNEVSKPNFRTWFEKSAGLYIEDHKLVVGFPNAFAVEYISKNQKTLIERCAMIANVSEYQIELVVSEVIK